MKNPARKIQLAVMPVLRLDLMVKESQSKESRRTKIPPERERTTYFHSA